MIDFFKKLFNNANSEKKSSIHVQGISDSAHVEITNIENLNINSNDEFDDILSPKISKSNLAENDKSKYVDIKTTDFLLSRFYFENENSDSLNFFNENQNKLTLDEIVKNNNKAILLGNPGLGKTVELESFANNLWNNKADEYIPIFRNLKNFTALNTIEDYINLKFNRFQKVVFILDGIDEITDIQGFTSKLENFIQKLEIEEKEFKILLSCRTNVYERIVKGVYDFKIYYLKDLDYNQSIQLLENKCGEIINSLDINSLDTSFLKSPFQINILANYINEKKFLPTNNAELWKEYIEGRFSIDENEKQKKIILDITLITDYCKKISLINELMQTNVFDEANLLRIVNKNSHDFTEFKKNPLIKMQLETKKWNFEHRNIQEYFAALSLSDLSFDEIREFIFIEKTNKTHPLLFNTITFLLNILDNTTVKFEKLIDFLMNNEPELLFKADKDRINPKIREKVFQKYFRDVCIDKTYWITTRQTYGINEIAEFADCNKNFDFLIEIIKDVKQLFRARISALNLISFFKNISLDRNESLKKFLIDSLLISENSKQVKSAMLKCISKRRYCIDDSIYLNKILQIFENDTNKEVNVELLRIINTLDNVDEYSGFIEEEFLRENKIKIREEKDEVSRGNSYVINDLILKIKNTDKFIGIIKYFFDYKIKINFFPRESKEIIEKCIEIDKTNKDFIINLLKELDLTKQTFYVNRPLQQLIPKLSNESINNVFKYIIDTFEFKEVSYFLSTLANLENLVYAIDHIKINKEIDHNEIEYFRNSLFRNEDGKLAIYFNVEMNKIGFDFKKELPSQEEILERKKDLESKPQKNFDILFHSEILLEEIKKIFEENYLIKINIEKYYEINQNWYNKNGHNNLIDTSYEILSKILYEYETSIEFSTVINEVNNEDFVIQEIKLDLGQNKNEVQKIEVSQFQKDFIFNWINKTTKEIKFELVSDYALDYTKWDIIMFFSKELNLQLPEDFLLKSLSIPENAFYSDDENLFNYLKTNIGNDRAIKEEIIENLKNDDLEIIEFDNQIDYAIEQPIMETLESIRKHLLNKKNQYNLDKKIYKFYKIENDVDFLKECCNDVNSNKAWDAIDILVKEDIERDFCILKALEYLEEHNADAEMKFLSHSLYVLFKFNRIEAVMYYSNYLNADLYPSLNSNYFANYNAIEDYSIIKLLFDKIYLDDGFDRSFNESVNFLSNYISNLSREEKSYEKIQLVLLSIRRQLFNKKDNNGIFNINLLIDHSNNSYINSKSKPLSFNESLKKVNEILN